MVVTRQPRVTAAWTARPPQPVPISSRWSSGPRSSFSQTQVELGQRRLLERHALALEVGARVHHRRVEHQRRTARCRGRSGRRCPCGCATACCAAAQSAAAARGPASSARRARSSAPALRAATRITATRSGLSQWPVGVGLGEPAAAAQQRAPRLRRADVDHRVRLAGAELVAAAALDDGQAAVADAAQRRAARSRGRSSAPHPLRAQHDRVPVDQRQHAQRAQRRRGTAGGAAAAWRRTRGRPPGWSRCAPTASGPAR